MGLCGISWELSFSLSDCGRGHACPVGVWRVCMRVWFYVWLYVWLCMWLCVFVFVFVRVFVYVCVHSVLVRVCVCKFCGRCGEGRA